MRNVFILDDLRSITMACQSAHFNRRPDDVYTLVRPFRHDGESIVADLHDAFEIIKLNPRFDAWILDNDLAPGVEGFEFLKEAITFYPDKVPEHVVSCSANFLRREKIETYHRDWLTSQ